MTISRNMRRRRRRVCTGAALAAILTACGSHPGPGTSPAPGTTTAADLEGSWHLVDGADAEGTLTAPPGREITLRVNDDRIGGVSGCNQYSASLSVTGDAVAFTDIGGTEMACEPEVMATERRYVAALGAIDSATRDAGALELTGPGSSLTFEPDPPPVDAGLTGTVWELEALIDGDSVSSTQTGGLLVLSDDGTWRASTGCSDLRGSYRLAGSTVTLTDRRTRPMADGACSEPALAQHEHVAGVLSGTFEVAVEEDRLRVTAPDGRGLEFRAR